MGSNKDKKKRTCLNCQKSFESTGPGNRICGKCTRFNKTKTTLVYKVSKGGAE